MDPQDPQDPIWEPCPACKGEKLRFINDESDATVGEEPCRPCKQTGLRRPSLSEDCRKCRGTGMVRDRRIIYDTPGPPYRTPPGQVLPCPVGCHDGRVSIATEGLVLELIRDSMTGYPAAWSKRVVFFYGDDSDDIECFVFVGAKRIGKGRGATHLAALLAALPEA